MTLVLFGFGLLAGGIILRTYQQDTPQASTPPPATIADSVIANCGKPQTDRISKVKGRDQIEMRTLGYGTTELLFFRDPQNPAWHFAKALVPGQSKPISPAEASKRLPCVKGGLFPANDPH